MFAMLNKVVNNISCCNLNRDILREVTVRIGLERINTQERVIVEVFLNSRTMGLVMSLEFARKQVFKLQKIKRPIYIRNVDIFFNKEDVRIEDSCCGNH